MDHATVTLEFGDGEHAFRLALGELRELQEKTGCGPAVLFRQLLLGEWKVDDAREIIRLGMIGGGASPSAALTFVRRYVDGRPLLDAVGPALQILQAALPGPEVGAKKFEAAEATIPETEPSTSPPSSATPPSSAGRRAKSTA
jgi:hypothetical protein